MVSRTVIIGAAPAGLTAAYKLARNGQDVAVIEPAADISKLATAAVPQDFFTGIEEIKTLKREIVGHSLTSPPRTSRIFYRYRLFDYPLSWSSLLKNLGPIDVARAALSYIHTQSERAARTTPDSFESQVTEQFGRYLYRIFFKPYAEKIWGMPADTIPAEWAGREIPVLYVPPAKLAQPSNTAVSFATDYAGLSASPLWEKCRHLIEETGATVEMNTRVLQIEHAGNRIDQVVVKKGSAIAINSGDHFIATLPMAELVARLHPPAPKAVTKAANSLKYRDLIVVLMTINVPSLLPDSSLYVYSPNFKVGRIQNYSHGSNVHGSNVAQEPKTTRLGMEYFCNQTDQIGRMTDAALIRLASQELADLGLVTETALIADSAVIRQRKAYPLYKAGYNRHLALLQDYLGGFENLQIVGCNGLHQMGTQSDAMRTGLFAAKNIIAGDRRNLRAVSSEGKLGLVEQPATH